MAFWRRAADSQRRWADTGSHAGRRVACWAFARNNRGSSLLPPLFLILANEYDEVLIKTMELSGNPAFLLGGTGRSCRSGDAPPALEGRRRVSRPHAASHYRG